MFLHYQITSNAVSPCQRMAPKAFALGRQRVHGTACWLEPRSLRKLDPAVAVERFAADMQLGLAWRAMR